MKSPTPSESRTIKFMILLGVFSVINFLIFFFQPEYRANPLLFGLLSATIIYSVLKKLYMWYNYSNITVPKTPLKKREYTVDILTTYFPGEPYQMITTTLQAIKDITYPHTTYLCDEADDPFLKRFCEENDIKHVTRDNRKDAKAGNINNALYKHATGDICVILDPDHIPEPHFLDKILPYFENPKIGFVQIVQSYYNIKESLVARGAAEQTFQFYGPMMMTLNAYGAVNAIGANCVFRRTALDSIGGHAPGLCEDMHTAMLLYAKGWKAVYVPEVLAKGLAPSNLSNFFKQQLKWARGTFDLLVNVYPKIFRKLTTRQKIHFGILPLHYLGGVISLINFLIPVLALLFSTTPWSGNIIEFGLVLIPVAASSLLIRTYIQKWVIEKKERGFHIVGGLMHINTWWIYILGLFYTLLNKKVPYLPTPKEDEWDTNLKIVIPNILVAFISIFAIFYGLNRDLTPFSLIMAGFAFFNTCIMLFGIYLSGKFTNRNKILRANLHKKSVSFLWYLKKGFYKIADFTFATTRLIALPLLLVLLISSMSFKHHNDLLKWEQVKLPGSEKKATRYFGIFHPSEENGLPSLQEINSIEKKQDINFDIISLYLAWTDQSVEDFPDEIMTSIYEKNALPLITWEPWASSLAISDSIKELKEEKKVFKYIAEGYFDGYIKEFSRCLKSFDKPVFLRFAHEFDNPQYPWSPGGDNSPEEFKAAWRHVHNLLKKEGHEKIIWVWNPWKAETMAAYYPGDDYVDWIGITLLNYGPLNSDGHYYPFENLYQPFHDARYWISRKPVMLAEFGSVKLGDRQDEWLKDAMNSINKKYDEISGIVMFDSPLDKNIPANDWYTKKHLDWTSNSLAKISEKFDWNTVEKNNSLPSRREIYAVNPIPYGIKGVRFKKGDNWRNNYYALTKKELTRDFKLLRETGINTIHFTGGNIYDYNILSYSDKFGLKVVYEFDIDNTVDYINDHEKLNDIKENILNKVTDLKVKKNVIAYSFNYDLKKHFEKPLLYYQRTAYIKWLTSLIDEIKSIDPEKSLVINIELDANTIFEIKKIKENLPIDSYGLILNDTKGLDEIISFSKKEDISVYISSLQPEILTEIFEKFENLNIILQNWQDERKSNWVTFDGLIDFKGRKKQVVGEVEKLWVDGNKQLHNTTTRILKPSEALYPGDVLEYHALLYLNNEWVIASKNETKYKFEWNLVKKDIFENKLAIKKLGTGPDIKVKIPENYKHYELMLIAKNKDRDYIISNRTTLHTPIIKKNF